MIEVNVRNVVSNIFMEERIIGSIIINPPIKADIPKIKAGVPDNTPMAEGLTVPLL
jgi:hypothetical protein